MTHVHVVLPNDIDDPATPSGGNAYDRQVCRGLAARGWRVTEHAVPGAWPRPSAAERAGLAHVLDRVPGDAVVLLDGLVASAVPEILVPAARRLRPVVLVHLPLDDASEREVLTAARAVVTTSAWTRRRLLDLYPLPADRVHVATPGVEPAPLAPGSGAGSELLCVAAVTPHKGHDVLVDGLAKVADAPWTCTCVGALSRDPAFVDRLRRQLAEVGLADRIRLVGPRTGADLDATYAAADLLVLASRGETYGMVVTEALARGIPVLATATGGLPEALGSAPDGSLPGVLVEPDAELAVGAAGADPAAMADALRRWLYEPELRRRLRRSARARRTTLTGWAVTAELISNVLKGVSA
ncbi:glycosyltransferase family 4 protein [Planosporangium mesophilum]|uniref:Glycosyl transferase n=1 Tax=Planosporangium mesophilum TaxID=689768 RepID=A0A8J3TGD3_9ACTN|nr:glycosyltransferase family 4 protein [Planosporangium mesophilum]NJC86239.1 glycosyltransferase family 4 protein [Planosporangium mesophilum]GII25764.1 glycosyl transferase [Planosporangium mesophilum]